MRFCDRQATFQTAEPQNKEPQNIEVRNRHTLSCYRNKIDRIHHFYIRHSIFNHRRLKDSAYFFDGKEPIRCDNES